MSFSARSVSQQAGGSTGLKERPAHLLAWTACGVVVGLVLVWSMLLGDRWAVYFVGILVGVGVLPILARLAGSFDRFLLVVFTLSLQAELSYDVFKVKYMKAAGPPGINISLILLAAAGLLWMRRLRQGSLRSARIELPPRLLRWSAVFLFSATVSVVSAPDHMLVLYGTWEIFTLILIAIAACQESASHEGIRTIKTMLFWGLGIQSVVIIVEFLTGLQFNLVHGISGTYAWASGEGGRYAGTMGSPSEVADFIVVCLLFLGGEMFASKGPTNQRQACLFALGFLALLMTETREAWIGFAIGATGLGSYFYRRGTISRRLLRQLAMGAVGAALLAWPLVSARLSDDHSADAQTRWNLVPIAMGMIKAHPLTGVGVNTADHQVSQYASVIGGKAWVFIVHNQFLLVFAEMGIGGFVSFVALFAVAIAAAARCMKVTDPVVRDTGAVLFWVLIVLVWALNLDSISSMAYKLVFFAIGITFGLDCLERRAQAAQVA